MAEIVIKSEDGNGITTAELSAALEDSIKGHKNYLKKILIIPPDYTRMHSGAGKITALYYEILKNSCHIDILPALGTHDPMSEFEIKEFFGSGIPEENIIRHNWRSDVVKIGEVPGSYVEQVSDGALNDSIDIEINWHLLDKSYDLIISIGQVVPHEVVGMANYSKNILVGCGGRDMINKTHVLSAYYGMERIMGRDNSPSRKIFDYVEDRFLKDLPLIYVLTATTQNRGQVDIHGLFIGRSRKIFEEAVKLSQKKNLIFVQQPLKVIVAYLDEKEFKSAWLGNKAIYRTRMAIEDGGELIILAPGVNKFGEDERNDELIRKYGYIGRKKIIKLCETEVDLKNNLSVAAHLIHGSCEGRFTITYAVEKLTKQEVEKVNFNYMSLKDAYKKYNPEKLVDGMNVLDNGEQVFFISNPALGLWIDKNRF